MTIFQNTDLQGKAALVTGAASGLGRTTALKLASVGASVFLVDVNEEALAETASLLGIGTEKVATQVADLSDPAACQAVVDAAVQKFGRLDALCNVAGLIYLANTPDMPLAQLQRTIDVNLMAPFILSQAAIPHLLENNGAIVNVASSASYIGEAYAAAYCASKWGIVGMTKAMAMEFQKKPIRINAVAPGGMITNIATNFVPPENCDFELLKRFSGMRGTVETEDVADMIVLLASDAGRGFHGACISIDAGITAG
ncbi:NAD(P)-dependent dehydrogenase (short-subunit alcohol dehydrogenase family) [Novosphingobium chloroacetimidivorans]|uniref:NAD(P)-dependent dehydrogenase (Short-subunit alcohol dehydrogenase family) n=1 Tax=Novosphingobium chloroacetimidivorans TaxID=1428314 RepID=A0A7W7K9U5_9SPHN|nr:SDR family oxidoreductase [Novosphingobium chloroacetimidivorans]MBB4858866.1 NAD(P)-dependent dehydrogenase (short-subunit alcohol dehydrogenase family) [Novosphingobium chloroacetimidivorans]